MAAQYQCFLRYTEEAIEKPSLGFADSIILGSKELMQPTFVQACFMSRETSKQKHPLQNHEFEGEMESLVLKNDVST